MLSTENKKIFLSGIVQRNNASKIMYKIKMVIIVNITEADTVMQLLLQN